MFLFDQSKIAQKQVTFNHRKMSKIIFFMKTRNGNYKALRDIEKGLSNEGASLKFEVPPNTVSTWVNSF